MAHFEPRPYIMKSNINGHLGAPPKKGIATHANAKLKMRTESPERTMEPSTMASTSSSRAMSGSGRREPLSAMTEVRETTRRLGIRGKLSDKLVGHAVGEVLLAGVAGEVLERQHGKRADCGATWSIEEAGSERMRADCEHSKRDENEGTQDGDRPKSLPGSNSRRDGGRSGDLRQSRRLDRNIRRLGRLGDLRLNRRNGCDEPVTRSGDCLHKLAAGRGRPQGFGEFYGLPC
jgi:hypothetical protein